MRKQVLVSMCVLAGVSLTAGGIWFAQAGKPQVTPSATSPGAGSGTGSDTSSSAPVPESAARVQTIKPRREKLKHTSYIPKVEVLPYERTDLRAKVSGYLDDIRKDIGDAVEEGEALARIRVPEMEVELQQKKALLAQAQAEIKQAEAAFAAAKAHVLTAEADLRYWKSQYERLARSKVVDQQTVDEALQKWESAAAALEESKAKQDKAQADVGVAREQLGVRKADRDYVETMLQYTKIPAPYKGVVTRRPLHTGAFTNARTSEQPVLFTVVRTNKLRVTLDIPEKDVRYLDVEHPDKHRARVQVDSLPGKTFVWQLTRFAPVLGEGKKVRAEIEIDNPIPDPDSPGRKIFLYPETYGHATVILEADALTLPTAYVHSDDTGSFVYRVIDGKAKKQYVTVGMTESQKVEIITGLSGTEAVISTSSEALRDGQPVEVAPAAAGR